MSVEQQKLSIIKFLLDHKGELNIFAIERRAGIPQRTLSQVMSGKIKLANHHVQNLENVLARYGYQI